MKGAEQSALMSYAEVAALLSTSVRTVRRAVGRGHLAAPKRFGGCVRFYRYDVEEFLRELRRAGSVDLDQSLVMRERQR